MTLSCELVSPEGLAYATDAHLVVAPGRDGDFGVLEHHAPLIASLRPGMIEIYATEQSKPVRRFITGGFAEVTGARCVILAEDISDPDNINRAEAEAMLAEAREELRAATLPQEVAVAVRRIEQAEALLLILP